MCKNISRMMFFHLPAFIFLLILNATSLLNGQPGVFPEDPAQAVKQYLQAIYARDYRAAYRLTSAEDRKLKSESDFLRENHSFSGVGLELTRKLADMIEWRDIRTEIQGDKATVTFTAKIPNASAPALRTLLLDFDPQRLSHLSKAAKQALIAKLEDLWSKGELPVIEGEESWDVVKEPAGWLVFLNWAGTIHVQFEAELKHRLPWQFWPVQKEVLAKPGQTLLAVYRAKNLSDKPVTAKARHIEEPKELAEEYLEIIQCFCLVETTLKPGEEKELPLVFRIRWDAPETIKAFKVRYEFYPIESFPWKKVGS